MGGTKLTCKDELSTVIKNIHEEEMQQEKLNRKQRIERIENLMGGIEGTTKGLTDEDLLKILIGLKKENFSNRINAIICKCTKTEGLNQYNTEEIIGRENVRLARDALRTLGVR